MGKHKIAIEIVEDKHKRHICFSKRRRGLFKKAKEFCKLGCEAAIVVISPAENAFTFANPDLDLVLDRFLREGQDQQQQQLALIPYPAQGNQEAEGHVDEEAEGGEEEEAKEELEDDETSTSSGEDDVESFEEDESKMEEDGSGAGDAAKMAASAEQSFWWNKPLEGLRMEELKEMERLLVELRGMAMERWKELTLQEPLSLAPIWARTRAANE